MKLILTILTFITLTATAQNKWYQPTRDEMLSTWLLAASGVFKGYHEAINYHGYGKGNDFIDINTSWKRKYKDYDGGDRRPAFPGSKTVFVFFTDANHLTAAGNTFTLIAGTAINFSDFKTELQEYKGWQRVGFIVVRKILPYMLRSMAFEMTYKNL